MLIRPRTKGPRLGTFRCRERICPRKVSQALEWGAKKDMTCCDVVERVAPCPDARRGYSPLAATNEIYTRRLYLTSILIAE
jgi:hypothetical protein